MKTVLFHSNQLSIRGTEVALYDYALYNETILGNKSFIISNKKNDLSTYDKFKKRFDVFLYDDFSECFSYANYKKASNAYFIKDGKNDNKIINNIKNSIHAVFQNKEIHGDSYAYVSKWLANKMNYELYVPHIVSLPYPTEDLRTKLNISKNTKIIGRHGGFEQFDISFVQKTIIDIVQNYNDIKFVFLNTKPFYYHDNIIYLQGTTNSQNKSNYINMCDAMIHARNEGESFGLAIAEFLYFNKPVFAWKHGHDLNHVEMLPKYNLYDEYDLKEKLLSSFPNVNYKEKVIQYEPIRVMKIFDEVFLKC